MRKGKTFIVSGPSGVGKSTVLQALMERRKNVYFSVSATTRDPRPGEADGVHYHFLDVDTFRAWIAKDEFLEYAEYVGNFYGTPKRFVDDAMNRGLDVILDIEVQGAIQVTGKRPGRRADLHCSAQLGRVGASADRARHGQPGKDPKASSACQGGIPNRPYL